MLRRAGTRSKNCAAKLRKADSVAGAHGLCSGRAFIKLSGKLPPSAAETPVLTGERNCRRLSAETKGDRTPSMVSCPLLTPQTFLLALTHRRCAAKRGLREHDSGRRADFGTLLCPEFTLRDWQRCQCAARRCRALDLRCENLRFHQAYALGAANAPVGPSFLDARPKGVAS